MLLREDDLQAIDDYLLAKRRLTNRHMFGPGVVCGLEVDCDPCKPGWLTVSPGYALDCCGNDIVLGCTEKLDALALLDELRRNSGVDCGEPCDDQTPRDYLLVVRYDEQPAEPVAPYAQDDCAVGDCEPSRMQEGYRFELLCDIADPEPGLFDRLLECSGLTRDRVKEDIAVIIRALRLASAQARVEATQQAAEPAATEVPTAKDFDTAEQDIGSIEPALSLISRATDTLIADAAHAAGTGPRIFTGRQRDLVRRRRSGLVRTLRESPSLAELPEIERQRALAILDQADQDPQELATLSLADRVWMAVGFSPADAAETYRADVQHLRTRILNEFDRTGHGNCGERDEISRLPLNRFDSSSRATVERLAGSYLSILDRCLCDLVNPPCPQCTETRVPLAVIRIEDCRVTDVCGHIRQWVLAPRTIGYWLPIAELLRELLLDRCCREAKEAKPVSNTKREAQIIREKSLQAFSLVRSAADAPEFRPLFAALAEPVVQAGVTSPPAEAAPEPAPPPVPAEDRVKLLEAQVAALDVELKRLKEQPQPEAAGGPADPGAPK
jgi:hypothetical protein